jgi:hypothetical protein
MYSIAPIGSTSRVPGGLSTVVTVASAALVVEATTASSLLPHEALAEPSPRERRSTRRGEGAGPRGQYPKHDVIQEGNNVLAEIDSVTGSSMVTIRPTGGGPQQGPPDWPSGQ